jgi:anti-sigma B factor antagonist
MGQMPAALPKSDVLALDGEIDLHRSPEVKAQLQPFVDRKTSFLLIDLSRVSYIDSSGLAVFIEAFQRVTAYGGRLGLFGLQDGVRNIFEIARLDQVFEIFPDESAAAQAVG